MVEKYLWGIDREMSLLDIPRDFDTIYVGGGTPGILTAVDLELLCKTLTEKNVNKTFEEFSVEFAPNTVRKDKIEVLKSYGCNRITLGVQSFNQRTLEILGRRQLCKQVFEAYDILNACGFKNVGLDLIFAIPGQTIDEWLKDLEKAVEMQPKHISTYNLTFEDGSPLSSKLKKRSEDEESLFFVETLQFLESNGYFQYEISNFCKPGYESKHNLNTWQMNEWIGVGPSACSQYMMERFSNPSSLVKWLNALENNKLLYLNRQKVENLFEDTVVFGLRTTKGIDLNELEKNFPHVDYPRLREYFQNLESEELALVNDPFARLTPKGQLVADAIAVDFICKKF